MTALPRLRSLAPLVAVVLVAVALGACEPVKKGPPPPAGDCSPHWRGYVLASDHNYAGLGAFSGSDRYMCKPTPWQGVRAQVQHLRNYADSASRHYNLGSPFEPRAKYDAKAFDNFIFKGKAPNWRDLNGKWAVPGNGYGERILGICENIRKKENPGAASFATSTSIRGPSRLSAAQIGRHVTNTVGNAWKPEITPTQMAQLFINEGSAVNVRGDVAFCQSILETGWFTWPSSPAAAGGVEASTAEADPAISGYFELQQTTTHRN